MVYKYSRGCIISLYYLCFFYIHVSFQLWVVAEKIGFSWQEPELPLYF